MGESADLLTRYKASMVLSGAGDALGYKNEEFEYCKSGVTIHETVKKLGGLENITVSLPDWKVSDDTVMHLATAEALTSGKTDKEELLLEFAGKYVECMKDMEGRKPGPSSEKGTSQLRPGEPKGYEIPWNPTGTGCGAAMRAMCIGLRFPGPPQLDDLILYSVESGRMTHHHPLGYLGSFASALFTSYAIQQKPLPSWGKGLIDLLPCVWQYVESASRCVEESRKEWGYFGDRWREYLKSRGIEDGVSDPVFPDGHTDVQKRDEIYATFSKQDDIWAGRYGHDAPMIAYEALMASGTSWNELCSRSMFHAGDSDSTGVIAACCYGAMYGYQGVPECNYKQLEYRERLEKAGEEIYKLANQN